MHRLRLNDSMLKNIERQTGMSVKEIVDLTPEESDARISTKIGKLLVVGSSLKEGLAGRGSPLIHRLVYGKDLAKRLLKIG